MIIHDKHEEKERENEAEKDESLLVFNPNNT